MQRSAVSVIALSGLVVLAGCSSNDKPKEEAKPVASQATAVVQTAPAKPLSVEESANVTVNASVKAIDYATREVTLDDHKGHEITLVAGPGVRRFNEVKVGDDIGVDYAVSLLAELRPPTADETQHPIQLVKVGARASKPDSPAGGVLRGWKVVTTVAAVDVPNMLVTLRGPMGDLAVVKGKKPENIKQLHVGDTVVITYTEAMAMAVRKAGW